MINENGAHTNCSHCGYDICEHSREFMGRITEENDKLKAEITRLEKIIAKEVSDNDEYGSEFVIANILRNENAALKKKITAILDVINEHRIAGNIENSVMLNNKLREIEGDL